jgi:hypothetical protein
VGKVFALQLVLDFEFRFRCESETFGSGAKQVARVFFCSSLNSSSSTKFVVQGEDCVRDELRLLVAVDEPGLEARLGHLVPEVEEKRGIPRCNRGQTLPPSDRIEDPTLS